MNTTIDIVGALLSLISGYFYIKERPIAWLISLIAIPFDVIMDLNIGVYGDLFLQVTYFVLLIYGWYTWRSGAKVEEGLPIIKMTSRQFYIFSAISFVTVTAIWLSLSSYTNSEVALLDALVTCLSLVALWFMCCKVIESWLLWIFVDCLYVTLYLFKQMPFHAFMSFFDACMCVAGYIYWVREYGAPIANTATLEDDPIPQDI